MRFAITGSTGFIGEELTRVLRSAGHQVTRVVRSYSGLPAGERAVVWHPEEGAIEAAGLEAHDVVIHLAGESLMGVWTEGKKRRIAESRERGTTLLATTVAGLDAKPRALFSASAVGIYGTRPSAEETDEQSAPGTGFLADVVRAWEGAAEPVRAAGVRTVHMRFGNVLRPDGGVLGVMLPLFRLGLGAKIGDGTQFWPWIALDDVAPALLHVLERAEIAGAVNFTAPRPVRNEEFTNALAAAVGRPSFLRVPKFAARLAPGGMGNEMLLSGARVVPRRLLDSGYMFRWPELKPALVDMLGR